jgi:hypothetical protein
MHRAGARAAAALSAAVVASAGALAVGPWTVAGASGNGLASKSASQILASVQKAEARTSGVHLTGRITQPSTSVSFSLDLTGKGDGKGTFHQSGEAVDVEKIGGDIYVRATTAFWRSNGAGTDAARMGDHWIKAPAGNPDFTSLAQFLGLTRLTTQLFPAGSAPVRTSKKAKVDGHPAVQVVGRSTTGGRTETTTLYVAATGRPYVLEAVAVSGSEKGVLTFSHYGEKVRVRPPPHPFDITSLGQPSSSSPSTSTPASKRGMK